MDNYSDHKEMNAWFKETFGSWTVELAKNCNLIKPMLGPAYIEVEYDWDHQIFDINNPTKERIMEIVKLFKEYIKQEESN